MKQQFFKYTKIRNVKDPCRGTDRSAGIDFFIPEDFKLLYLNPHDDILIPSGIKISIPGDTALLLVNKSSIPPKMKLVIGSCLVDSDYQGEIHIHLINISSKITILSPGIKIAQGILIPVLLCQPEKIETEELLYAGTTSKRGSGGFGSTGQI